MRRIRFAWFLMLLAGGLAAASPAAVETMIARQAVVYAGPGDTYAQAGALRPGHPVTIVERSRIGNWLRVTFTNPNDGAPADGWLPTAYLQLPADLRFSAIPVNAALPDADLSQISSEALTTLYAAPVISPLDDSLRAVFARGQARGHAANRVTKVGDSVSYNPLYLAPLAAGSYELGPYDYLAETVEFFASGIETRSAAAKIGLTAFSVFDPVWASPRTCQDNEPPLTCEYRRTQPSIAFIMFGTNDMGSLNSEQFERQMRLIVEETLAAGIIPVLSTFPADPEADGWPQAVRFNTIIVQVAQDDRIPLINLWAAARALPGDGLSEDSAHLTVSGERVNLADGYESLYGVSLQNLLALVMLDDLRRAVVQPG